MEKTARLRLPMLSAGQAQKEVTHNEALILLDAAVFPSVEESARATPPTEPAVGSCYIVAEAPTGAWSDHAGALAIFTGGGWRFIAPQAGMSAFVKSTGVICSYRSNGWESGAAIADPSGGTQVDGEARTAIAAMLTALREHGLIAS